MIQRRILVLADDLTGAAEIAGIGFAHGLKTALVLDPQEAAIIDAELLVFDTNSRLDAPETAAAKVRFILARQPASAGGIIFKKVDSAMRGVIATELEAAADQLGRPRILLCPCNPSRGRVIHGGRYLIDGVPLDQTGFSGDPYHPAKSDRVLDLLGPTRRAHSSATAAQPLPSASCFVVGDAIGASDMKDWAARTGPDVLPAGGADFFTAILESLGLEALSNPCPPQAQAPHLFLSGSLAPSSRAARERAVLGGLACAGLPASFCEGGSKAEAALDHWIGETTSLLENQACVLACADAVPPLDPSQPPRVKQAFSRLAQALGARGAFRHLLAEGGDIAAGAATALGWKSMKVQGVWAPGVVCLMPDSEPMRLFSIKPGSYAWPSEIWSLLMQARH